MRNSTIFLRKIGTQTVLCDNPVKTKKLKRGLIGHSMLCTTKPTSVPADGFSALSLSDIYTKHIYGPTPFARLLIMNLKEIIAPIYSAF
jgi:hypothetical protein